MIDPLDRLREHEKKLDRIRAQIREREPAPLEKLVQREVPERLRVSRNEQQRELELRELARVKRTRWRGLVDHNVPHEAREHVWDPQPTPAIGQVDRWLRTGCKRHIVLRGVRGCGKSVAAAYAAKCLLEPLKPGSVTRVCWVDPDELVSAVFHPYDEQSPKLAKYIVIDDMGKETKPDFTKALWKMLDTAGHKILITTHIAKDADFRSQYGQLLVDRLNNVALSVKLKNGSMRRTDGGF